MEEYRIEYSESGKLAHRELWGTRTCSKEEARRSAVGLLLDLMDNGSENASVWINNRPLILAESERTPTVPKPRRQPVVIDEPRPKPKRRSVVTSDDDRMSKIRQSVEVSKRSRHTLSQAQSHALESVLGYDRKKADLVVRTVTAARAVLSRIRRKQREE